MTNHDWKFSKRDTASIKFINIDVINDYTAIAMCLPELTEQQLICIGRRTVKENHTKAVFGPGTGLGVATLEAMVNQWVPIDGEGGHVDFAPIMNTT